MKIVAGFIRTPEGRAALDRAIAETKERNGHLVVIHSLRGDERDADDTIVYRQEFEDLGAELRTMELPHTLRELVRGQSPAEDIIQTADEEEADLIVIGLRRRTRTGKFLLGSNAHEILMDANCAVLAVKAGPAWPATE
jgi:nucleotide-binding universal stress UspA family protein